MEENKTCQADFKMEKAKNPNQKAQEGMVHKAKEAVDTRKAPRTLQHTHPWQTSESETDWQKTSEDLQEGSLW